MRVLLSVVAITAIVLVGANWPDDEATPSQAKAEPRFQAVGHLEFRSDGGWDRWSVLVPQEPIEGPRMASSMPGGADATNLSFVGVVEVRLVDAMLLRDGEPVQGWTPVLLDCAEHCDRAPVLERGNATWAVELDSPGYRSFGWGIEYNGERYASTATMVAVNGRWDVTGEVYPNGHPPFSRGATDTYRLQLGDAPREVAASTRPLDSGDGDLAIAAGARGGMCVDRAGISEDTWGQGTGTWTEALVEVGHPASCTTAVENTGPVAYALTIWAGPSVSEILNAA